MSTPPDGPFSGQERLPRRPLKLVDGERAKPGGSLFLLLAVVMAFVVGGWRWGQHQRWVLAEEVWAQACQASEPCEQRLDERGETCLKKHWVNGGRYSKGYLDRAAYLTCMHQP
jgi:hypothetical protein